MPEGEDNNASSGPDLDGFMEQLQGLLSRNDNDWSAVAQKLFKENYELREDRRKLRSEVSTLKGKAVPEGAKVLEGEELTKYQALQALGDPEQVSTQLAELSNLRRDVSINRLASHHGLKEQAVKRLVPADAQIETTGEGKDLQYVLKTGDKAQTVKELLEGEWKDFTPALQPGDNRRRVLGQRGDLDGGSDDMVASFLSTHNKRGGDE